MSRRIATFVWAALLLVPCAFFAVASTLTRNPAAERLVRPAFWAAVGVSALNVALSLVLPRQIAPARVHDREAVAFGRILLCLALCEAAAMAPIVAYLLTGDPRLLGVFATALLALALLYPSDARWEAARPSPGVVPGADRRVR